MWEPYIPDALRDMARQVNEGQRPAVTVRTLLSWFWGSKKRGRWIVSVIRQALEVLDLRTDPDFDWVYLDASITFVPRSEPRSSIPRPAGTAELTVSVKDGLALSDSASTATRAIVDPVYRIGRLGLANNLPVSVLPDDAVDKATTIMLRNDYSLLPVMADRKTVIGIFGWKSLGSRRALGQTCTHVKDAIDDHCEITPDTPLFKAIDLVEEHDCVLLRSETGEITSIITPYDISVTFGQLSEPFLVIRDIENQIRGFIAEKFSDEEVVSALKLKTSPPKGGIVHSLMFGDYVRFLDDENRWAKLSLNIDLETFRDELDAIREIRNDVMHFDPEGITNEELGKLRGFADFLRRIKKLKTLEKGASR